MMPVLAGDSGVAHQIKQGQYSGFRFLVGSLSVLLAILMLVRSIIVVSAVSAMLYEDGGIVRTWTTGHVFVVILTYFVISIIPVIGSIFNLLLPVIVIALAFTIGDGIGGNFVPYLLPVVVAYIGCGLLVYTVNLIANFVTKRSYPNVYRAIANITDQYGFEKVAPGRMTMVPKVK